MNFEIFDDDLDAIDGRYAMHAVAFKNTTCILQKTFRKREKENDRNFYPC